MFSIGEFSRITGLTIKTLRFYHEQGILEPSRVDAGSGYRFYAESKIETARMIRALRDLEFSIAEISDILSRHSDDADLVEELESRRREIQDRIRSDRRLVQQLDVILKREREAAAKMKEEAYVVEEKSVDPLLIAGIRMTGRYSDCGKLFGKLGRRCGRHIYGKPMMLCYNSEYREDDADFEACMPVRKGESKEDISVRELPGGSCLSLMHIGPYETIGRAYEQLIREAHERGFEFDVPTREIYHKGPGMIFRGNPARYLTEVQLMRKAAS